MYGAIRMFDTYLCVSLAQYIIGSFAEYSESIGVCVCVSNSWCFYLRCDQYVGYNTSVIVDLAVTYAHDCLCPNANSLC